MANSEEFETQDLYLAAYFALSGCQLVRRVRQGQRVTFIYTNPGGSIKALREAYYANQAKVSALEFAQKIMAQKQLLSE